jgi:hypothetical protein
VKQHMYPNGNSTLNSISTTAFLGAVVIVGHSGHHPFGRIGSSTTTSTSVSTMAFLEDLSEAHLAFRVSLLASHVRSEGCLMVVIAGQLGGHRFGAQHEGREQRPGCSPPTCGGPCSKALSLSRMVVEDGRS